MLFSCRIKNKTAQARPIFLLLSACVALSIVWVFLRPTGPQVCVEDFCVHVEAVSRKEQMIRGLQGRESLGPEQGMLFIFKEEGLHRFWMKDMKMSIDMIWLDRFGKVVSIGEDIKPCMADPCTVYAPAASSLYVLEVQSGFSRRHGLEAGDTLILKGL